MSYDSLLGLAEAGFAPGMIFYLSLWFPARLRARYCRGVLPRHTADQCDWRAAIEASSSAPTASWACMAGNGSLFSKRCRRWSLRWSYSSSFPMAPPMRIGWDQSERERIAGELSVERDAGGRSHPRRLVRLGGFPACFCWRRSISGIVVRTFTGIGYLAAANGPGPWASRISRSAFSSRWPLWPPRAVAQYLLGPVTATISGRACLARGRCLLR